MHSGLKLARVLMGELSSGQQQLTECYHNILDFFASFRAHLTKNLQKDTKDDRSQNNILENFKNSSPIL